jgi:hypothetical protein
MATEFFKRIFFDYEDRENNSGRRPGFEVVVVEEDEGVGLLMHPQLGLDGVGVGRAQIYMTPEQTHELLQGLLDAVDRAEAKRTRRASAH